MEAIAESEYLKTIGAKELDLSLCEITHSIRPTDVERLSRLVNATGKGWPVDPEEQTPYSFVRNVSLSDG